jgi:murein DD-endopeptidase MepM/ murein hydrolase activator NlpD
VLENLILTRELNKQVYPEGSPVEKAGSHRISASARTRSPEGSHKGVDFATDAGTDVTAVAAGLVTWAATARAGYGQMVEINHGNDQLLPEAFAVVREAGARARCGCATSTCS